MQRTIYAGPVPATIIGAFDPVQHAIVNDVCIGEAYYFEASNPATGDIYFWTLTPPAGSSDFPTLNSGATAYFSFTELGCYTLKLEKTNSCGGTVVTERFICVEECVSGFRVMVSPNPAQSTTTVTIDNETEEVAALGSDADIDIELYQFNTGTKKKQWKFKNVQSQFSLNLNGLSKGMYLIKVKKGSHLQSTRIILE